MIIKKVIIESNETGYHIYEKPYWYLGKKRQGLLQTLHTYNECLEWLKNEYGEGNYKIVKYTRS